MRKTQSYDFIISGAKRKDKIDHATCTYAL